jgi:hypothetical protein
MTDRPPEIDEAWWKLVMHFKTRAEQAEAAMRITPELRERLHWALTMFAQSTNPIEAKLHNILLECSDKLSSGERT